MQWDCFPCPGHTKGNTRQGWVSCGQTGGQAQGADQGHSRVGHSRVGHSPSPHVSHLVHPPSAQGAHSTNPAKPTQNIQHSKLCGFYHKDSCMHSPGPFRAVKQDFKPSSSGMGCTNLLQQLHEILTDSRSSKLTLFVVHSKPHKAETVWRLQLYKIVLLFSNANP